MASATGSQAYIAVVKQDPATPKEIPVNPAMQKVNFSSDDLSTNVATKVSDHIRDDRMTSDVTITGFEVGGGYTFEFQYENSLFDELLLGFLWAESWSPVIDADIAGGTFTVAGAKLDLTSAVEQPVLVDGQKLRISGTAGGVNDGVYTLMNAGADIYTVTPAPVADEVLPTNAWASGSMARNGKFYQPFFVERGHTDVQEYFKLVGMACNNLTLEMPDQSDVTGNYQFVGLTSKVDQAVETGATYADPTTNPIFSTVTNMPSVSINGVKQESCFIKEMTLELTNNVTPKTGIGVLGACETAAHRLGISGSITMYFSDSTMYNRLLNGEAFSLDWVLEDNEGHGYAFSLPRVKLSEDTIPVTGVDDDVMDNATYISLADDVTQCMIQIDRYSL